MFQNIVLMFLKSNLLLNKAINMSVKWLEKKLVCYHEVVWTPNKYSSANA